MRLEVIDATGTVIAGNGVMGFDGVATGFGARFTAMPVCDSRGGRSGVLLPDPRRNRRGNQRLRLDGDQHPGPGAFDLELRDIIELGTVVSGVSTTNFVGNPALSGIDDFYTGKYVTFLIDPVTGSCSRSGGW